MLFIAVLLLFYRACRACIEDLFQENPVQACPFKSVHAEEGDSSPECYPHGLTYPGTSDIIFDRQAQVENREIW